MNICVLTHTFPRNKQDVSAAFMKEFADGLVQAGSKVTVVTPYDPEFKRSDDIFKIVTYKYVWPKCLHLLGYSRSMKSDLSLRWISFLLALLMFVFGTIALYKTVKKEKIDLINAHWILPNGLMALCVSKLTNVPYVITLPGTDVSIAYRYKILGLLAKIIARYSMGLISNSRYLLNRILTLGVSDIPTAIIPYPVDADKYFPSQRGVIDLRMKLGLNKNDSIILAVGRLVDKKGFKYLIEAMPEIIKKHPNVKLILGGEGNLLQSLVKLAKDLRLGRKVIFTGTIKRDEIAVYYNLADVMAAPSIVDKNGNLDGGPVVCFESMACGKPQVVTDILGVAEFIKNGVNGYVVPEKNSKLLAVAVNKILDSPSLAVTMGENNRKLVMFEFTTQDIGKKYLDFINNHV